MNRKAFYRLPNPTVQSVGIVMTPRNDLPAAMHAIGSRPIAAAVLRLEQAPDGECAISVRQAGALMALEEPLPRLLDAMIDSDALTIIPDADLDVLAIEAAARRTFAEPNIAAMLEGYIDTVDPVSLAGGGSLSNERLLCRRLGLPMLIDYGARRGRVWREGGVALIDRHALASAVTRMMLWATLAATRNAEPGLFYEPVLALRDWLLGNSPAARALALFARSRPMRHAVACEFDYRAALSLRDPK